MTSRDPTSRATPHRPAPTRHAPHPVPVTEEP